MSRLCEEFGCLPSQALQEWRLAPAGLLEEILEYRAYAHAKQVRESAEQPGVSDVDRRRVMSEPLVQVVTQIEFGLRAQEIEAQKQADGST